MELQSQKERAADYLRVRQAYSRLSCDEATLDVLYNDNAPLTDLFRYCWAVKANTGPAFQQFINEMHRPAVLQYLRDQESYDAAWQEWLPPGFAEQAAATYLELLVTVDL